MRKFLTEQLPEFLCVVVLFTCFFWGYALLNPAEPLDDAIAQIIETRSPN